MIKRFIQDENGATAIEYGLIVGLIFVVITTALGLFADRMQVMFDYINDNLSGAIS